MINFNFLRESKPTCVSQIYEKLGSVSEDSYEEIPGYYERNVRVVVENIEPTSIIDEVCGIKRAWASCVDCGEKLSVAFRPGGVKTIDANGVVKYGDMEPGKAYEVEGNTMIDHHGTLVISNNM